MIINGNCFYELGKLDEESVQCLVTSPPYWNLRDYQTAPIQWADGELCQLGQEDTPEAFIGHLVEIFSKVKRILKKDGVIFVNLGDTYFGPSGGHWDSDNSVTNSKTGENYRMGRPAPKKHVYLKTKDLVGIPWKFAIEMQKDGWYLRNDIIWSKPNPMPEAVKDRCAKSHEHIFMLTKSPKYYFDYEAIKEKSVNPGDPDKVKKDVWRINTSSYKGAHFAVYPEELVIPCIKAGSREGDIVIDIFGGSGTTGLIAKRLKRKYILIELNEEYIPLINKRLNLEQTELF